jgi:capsular exopolysaccharide synthesis family protein
LKSNSPKQSGQNLTSEQMDLLAAVGLQPQAEQESSQGNEVLKYLGVIWDKRWLVLFCVFVFLTVGALQLRRAKPVYTAVAVVRYEPTSLQVVDFADIGRRVNIHDELRTQMEIIRSGAIAKAVIEALGLDEAQAVVQPTQSSPMDYVSQWVGQIRYQITSSIVKSRPREIPVEVAREQQRITSMQNMISLRRLPDTKLIEIIVRHPDNVMAARIADEFAVQFQAHVEEQKVRTYDSAKVFLEREVSALQVALEGIDNQLFDLNNKDDVRMLTEQQEVTRTNLADIIRDRQRKEIQLATLQSLADEKLSEDENIRTVILQSDTEYLALQKDLRGLALERTALMSIAGVSNPQLNNLNLRIAELERMMGRMEQDIYRTRLGEISQLTAEITALYAVQSKLEQELQELSVRMLPIRRLESERETKEQNYRTVLARYGEVAVGRDAETGQVAITDRAKVPTFPTEPRVTRSLTIYTIMGFLFGCALALGLNFLDLSISDPRSVERIFGLPTLGLIPFMGGNAMRVPFGRKRGRRNVIRLIHTVDPYSSEAEAFRLLRTSLQYSTAGHSPQLIQVTSCFPSEGKSTAAANLAISFATLGERTLLIDADLKLPSLHRIFGVPKRPGLSDVLTGQMTSENVIVPTGIENLDIMPVGPKSPCPVELLESPMMTDIFDELRERYKTIVVDSTPLHGMSDAFVLSRKVDGVVLVVSVGKTRIDGFKKIVTQLQSMKARLLGVVYNHQNRVRRADRAYYYTGYYRYGTSAPDPEDRADLRESGMFQPADRRSENEKIGSGRD